MLVDPYHPHNRPLFNKRLTSEHVLHITYHYQCYRLNMMLLCNNRMLLSTWITLMVLRTLSACLNGCTCRRGTMECLSTKSPTIPILGRAASSITTVHITEIQLAWAKRRLCRSTNRIKSVYLHEATLCHTINVCERTIMCWYVYLNYLIDFCTILYYIFCLMLLIICRFICKY
jgi:hypothetical protein